MLWIKGWFSCNFIFTQQFTEIWCKKKLEIFFIMVHTCSFIFLCMMRMRPFTLLLFKDFFVHKSKYKQNSQRKEDFSSFFSLTLTPPQFPPSWFTVQRKEKYVWLFYERLTKKHVHTLWVSSYQCDVESFLSQYSYTLERRLLSEHA